MRAAGGPLIRRRRRHSNACGRWRGVARSRNCESDVPLWMILCRTTWRRLAEADWQSAARTRGRGHENSELPSNGANCSVTRESRSRAPSPDGEPRTRGSNGVELAQGLLRLADSKTRAHATRSNTNWPAELEPLLVEFWPHPGAMTTPTHARHWVASVP